MSLRHSGALLGPAGLSGVFAPRSLFRENIEHLDPAADQTPAKKLANQLYYGIAAQTGKFYGYAGVGYGGQAEGFQTFLNWKEASKPLWVAPFSQPTVKVWLVEEEGGGEKGGEKGPEETLRTGKANEELQALFTAVPLPTLPEIPHGQVEAVGSDAGAVIWRPGSDECWEIHRLGRFLHDKEEGAQKVTAGEWKFGYGHYQSRVSRWNGVCAASTGLLSASGLSKMAGTVTLADLVRVMRGETVGHALSVSVQVRPKNHVAPAISHDSGKNTHAFLKDGVTPNPAYWTVGAEGVGSFDAVPEGTRCRFPPASRAVEYSLTRPWESAIYEAIREYGLLVADGGPNAGFYVADPRTYFTKYCDTPINALNVSSQFQPYVNEGTTEPQRAGWVDPTLATFTGILQGVTGVLSKMPWRTLELLPPKTP